MQPGYVEVQPGVFAPKVGVVPLKPRRPFEFDSDTHLVVRARVCVSCVSVGVCVCVIVLSVSGVVSECVCGCFVCVSVSLSCVFSVGCSMSTHVCMGVCVRGAG